MGERIEPTLVNRTLDVFTPRRFSVKSKSVPGKVLVWSPKRTGDAIERDAETTLRGRAVLYGAVLTLLLGALTGVVAMAAGNTVEKLAGRDPVAGLLFGVFATVASWFVGLMAAGGTVGWLMAAVKGRVEDA